MKRLTFWFPVFVLEIRHSLRGGKCRSLSHSGCLHIQLERGKHLMCWDRVYRLPSAECVFFLCGHKIRLLFEIAVMRGYNQDSAWWQGRIMIVANRYWAVGKFITVLTWQGRKLRLRACPRTHSSGAAKRVWIQSSLNHTGMLPFGVNHVPVTRSDWTLLCAWYWDRR